MYYIYATVCNCLPFCVCVCVSGCICVCVCVYMCEQKVHQLKWNRRLSTFLKLEICHPQEKASVWLQLIPSDYLCQQYFSLFPACGCSYLDHLSRRRVKTQASMCGPLLIHSERPFRRTLCCVMLPVVSQVCTHRDCKWTANRHWRWRHEYKRNNSGLTWLLSKLMKQMNPILYFSENKKDIHGQTGLLYCINLWETGYRYWFCESAQHHTSTHNLFTAQAVETHNLSVSWDSLCALI